MFPIVHAGFVESEEKRFLFSLFSEKGQQGVP